MHAQPAGRLLLALLLLPGISPATDECEQLQDAVSRGHAAEIRRHLANGVDINCKDNSLQLTPLQVAASEPDCYPSLVFLLENGADPNLSRSFTLSPLASATADTNWKAVRLLVAHGADQDVKYLANQSPLLLAIKADSQELVTFLCKHGADVRHCAKPVETAMSSNNLPMLKCLVRNGANIDKALMSALGYGMNWAIEYLLDEGADVNYVSEEGKTPLFIAGYKGNIDVVSRLLELGADVNLLPDDSVSILAWPTRGRDWPIVRLLVAHGASQSARFLDWDTPLHVAAERDSCELAAFLIDHGADVNCKGSYGRTPLMMAVRKGNTKMVSLLLARGADVNSRDDDGQTALSMALKNCDYKTAQLLLQVFPTVDVNDNDGVTPLHHAASCGNFGLVRWLVARGARTDAPDSSGRFALHYAAGSNNPKLVSWLAHENPDALQRPDIRGNTPLHHTLSDMYWWHPPDDVLLSIDTLVHLGADINARNGAGSTVLHLAVLYVSQVDSSRQVHIAKLVRQLLERGANPALRGNGGKTAFGAAAGAGLDRIQEILLTSGYDFSAEVEELQRHAQMRERARRRELTRRLFRGGLATSIPLSYLGASVYLRERRFRGSPSDNLIARPNTALSFMCLGMTGTALVAEYFADDPLERVAVLFWGLVGAAGGTVAGIVVSRGTRDNPFLYYCAPVYFSIAVPLIYFTAK